MNAGSDCNARVGVDRRGRDGKTDDLIREAMALPRRVALLATGGTIAMASEGHGAALKHGAAALANGLGLDRSIVLEPSDITSKPSASIGLNDIAKLAQAIETAFADGVDGVVVTHGTDTIEETAFALSLMLRVRGPVVLTAAMRPASAVGADGPANLLAAIRVALTHEAAELGPVVVFDDEIHAAQLVRKVHSSRSHAFSSAPFGPMGCIVEGHVEILSRRGAKGPCMVFGGRSPVIPILTVGLDLEPETIDIFAGPAIEAVVIAGTGGGHVAARTVESLSRLAALKPVILASRAGTTLRNSYAYGGSETDLLSRGLLYAGRWNPLQARIIAQLALSLSDDREALARALAPPGAV